MTKAKERPSGKPDRPNPISRSSGGRGGPPGPPREISQAEREGVSPTDTEARSALGVGESYGRRGESIAKHEGKEAGRREVGTTGKAKRPAGTSTARDQTTVKPPQSDES
jgi:hypothetical protein